MTPEQLDAMLDDPCQHCGRPYRWCECHASPFGPIIPTISEDIVAEDVTYLLEEHDVGLAAALIVWARYRAAKRPEGPSTQH